MAKRFFVSETGTTVETFSQVDPTKQLVRQVLVSQPAARSKRSATLKSSRKEKLARRPGEEDVTEVTRRIRVMSCHEIDWIDLTTLFPTATCIDQQLVYFASEADPEVCSFFFPYGVCVFWGVEPEEARTRVALMNQNGVRHLRLRKVDFTGIRDDDFFYFTLQAPPAQDSGVKPPAPPPLVLRDGPRFTLLDHGIRLKLVLSHAFSQSVRLDVLEQQFRRISVVTKDIAPKQRQTGRIPSDWEEVDILSTMGALDAIRRELEIDGCIRSSHDLFWDEDELSEVLDSTREYLEIDDRVEHLLDQIALVRSQLVDLQTEIHALRSTDDHHRAIRREWYIIILIFYEAVVVKLFDIGAILAHLLGL